MPALLPMAWLLAAHGYHFGETGALLDHDWLRQDEVPQHNGVPGILGIVDLGRNGMQERESRDVEATLASTQSHAPESNTQLMEEEGPSGGGLLGGLLGALTKTKTGGPAASGPRPDWCPKPLPALCSMLDCCSIMDNKINVELKKIKNLPRLGTPNISNDEEAKVLRSHTSSSINIFAISIIASICAVTGLMHCTNCLGSSCSGVPSWAAGMILSSYSVLIPGLFLTGFSFSIAFTIPMTKMRLPLTQDDNHKPGPVTESYWSLIHRLYESNNNLGVFLVLAYAFVMPALKLILLALGQYLRKSQDLSSVRAARRCIILVKVLSKWAAPDMFAFVLLYFLFRALYLPDMVESLAVLDLGFTCFAIFCFSSAASTLAIEPPRVEAEEGPTPPPLVLRLCDRRYLGMLVGLTSVLGIALLWVGCRLPCFGIRANANVEGLVEPNGKFPANFSFKVQMLGNVTFQTVPLLTHVDLGNVLNAEVSLSACMHYLLLWYAERHVFNDLLAFIMVGVFAVGLTFVNFVVLIFAGLSLSNVEETPMPIERGARWTATSLAFVLKHLAMLDVCIMGVVVVTAAAGTYAKQGIELHMMKGMLPLLACEMLHYFGYYMVTASAEHLATQANGDVASKELDTAAMKMMY